MAGATDIVVRLIADSSKLQDEVSKVDNTGGKIKGWAKGVGAAIGGAFAVKAVGDFISSAEEANSVSAGLAQSLSNAGDATGEWAKHAEDLASTLQDKTGIDDEVIKGSQTILATFHDLSGATGQASGAFDRATKAALDMSKTGFGDANSAATMLGKALEDPEKGLTALGKVGITFTDAQKAQIKAMVESGDKAGAMGKILENVEGQVGGMAEKTVTGADKMNVAWGETQESVGQALLPVMNALVPILQTVAKWVQENSKWLVPLVGAVAAVTAGVWLFNAALAANPIVLITIAIAALIAGLILAYQNVDWFRAIVDTAFAAVKVAIDVAVTAFQWLWNVISTVFSWVVDHWQLLVGILTGPIGVAVMLIVGHWDTIWNAIKTVFDWIVNVFTTVVRWIIAPFQSAWDWIRQVPGWITGAFQGILDWVSSTFQTIEGWITKPFKAAWDWIDTWVIGPIKTGISSAIDIVKNSFNSIADLWNGTVGKLSFSIPDWVPGIGGKGFDMPDIPRMAAGGIVTRPTLAVVGERGAEAVIPLDRFAAGGTTIVVNVTTRGLGADAPQIQSAVVAALRGYVGRNGPIPEIAG